MPQLWVHWIDKENALQTTPLLLMEAQGWLKEVTFELQGMANMYVTGGIESV